NTLKSFGKDKIRPKLFLVPPDETIEELSFHHAINSDGRYQTMKEEQPPGEPKDVVAWAKQWQPKWQTHITFPENAFFVGLFDFINRSNDLDATIRFKDHQLLLRFEHSYDPEEFEYSIDLPDLEAKIDVVPFKPDYGVLKKRHFLNRAKALDRLAQDIIHRMQPDQKGSQIRTLDAVMSLLDFSEEVIEITRETLFGNPDPTKYRYLNNPVSFLNLQNGWLVVPNKDVKLKLNLGVEYEHVFRLSYRFDPKEGPVVENYQKYESALQRLSRQTIRRVFSNLGTYTSIIHNPFFSDISQRFPVRYVALNNGMLLASLGYGSTWENGTFEFYKPTERRELLFELLDSK
ncbi:MAG: hypothetical protein ACFFD8_08245, partial [Candidatus Thorarchaeota archaeon]